MADEPNTSITMEFKGGGPKGEMEDKIVLTSVALHMHNTGSFASTSGGGGKGPSQHHLGDLQCSTDAVGLHTCAMLEALQEGKHLKQVELKFYKNKFNWQTYKIQTALINTHNQSHFQDGRSSENFTLTFDKMDIEYKQQDESGDEKGTGNAKLVAAI